jgi:hypothetical protein
MNIESLKKLTAKLNIDIPITDREILKWIKGLSKKEVVAVSTGITVWLNQKKKQRQNQKASNYKNLTSLDKKMFGL